MPIYEYQCRRCEHRLEKLQKISDAPLIRCPACGEDSLLKLISAAGFRLKGGGWYETDFKNGNKRNLAGDSGSEGKAANAPTNGSDSGEAGSGGKPDPVKSDKPAASKPAESKAAASGAD